MGRTDHPRAAQRVTSIGDANNASSLEPYVDRKTLAAFMCVSVATIDRMVADGMPSETWGRRARRFKLPEALAWARREEPD